jgi:hypothetical protein
MRHTRTHWRRWADRTACGVVLTPSIARAEHVSLTVVNCRRCVAYARKHGYLPREVRQKRKAIQCDRCAPGLRDRRGFCANHAPKVR